VVENQHCCSILHYPVVRVSSSFSILVIEGLTEC
jgi:hypothetical protein